MTARVMSGDGLLFLYQSRLPTDFKEPEALGVFEEGHDPCHLACFEVWPMPRRAATNQFLPVLGVDFLDESTCFDRGSV